MRAVDDFRRLWLALTSSELGTRMGLVVFPLWGFALTGSVRLAGLVEAAHLLGLVLVLLPAGVLADRIDRGRLLRGACLAAGAAYAVAGAAAALGLLTYPHLLATALVAGVSAGVVAPAEIAAVRTVVPPAELPRALSLNQGRLHVAGLIGAPLGGLAYGLARSLPLLANAAGHLLALVVLRGLRTDLTPPARPARSARSIRSAGGSGSEPRRATADLRAGLRHLARHPLFRRLSAWAFASNLTANLLFLVAVLRLVEDGVPGWQLGLVEAASAAAGVVGALLAPRIIDRLPTGWLTIAVAWSPLPLAVPMALWPHPAVVGAALAGVLVLNPAGNAGMASYRIRVTPPDLVGRLQSASQFVSMLPLPLAPVLAGVLLHALGGRDAVLVAAASCGLSAVVVTTSRLVRAVPRPADWPAPPGPVPPGPMPSGQPVEDPEHPGPGRVRGVDEGEVVAADAHQLGAGAGRGGGAHVGLGLADRHDVVGVAVHAPDRHGEGHHAHRVDVAVGGGRRVTQERLDGAAAEALGRRGAQVEHAGLADHVGQHAAGSRPGGEVAAG